MISPSLTFSSALLAWPLIAASLTGKVELRDSKEAAVRKKLDYSGVVLWLEPAAAKPPLAEGAPHARMVQQNKMFMPHILAVRTGTTIDFPNYDPIFHNAFSNYDGQVFDVGLYSPGTSRSVRFTRPGVVRVFCNIHANMSAVIVVVSTPYLATTGKDGSFSFADVEPGEYTLKVFHERATPETLRVLERRITAGTEARSVPLTVISENGYLSLPHTNKYGRDYTAAPDEGGAYPVTRK